MSFITFSLLLLQATMQLLKNLSIGYTAHLKDIRLINFTIDAHELQFHLPQLPVVKLDGRPVISLLDVKLYHLRPSFLLNPFHFTYRHIAFRVLVNDNHLHHDKVNRGFYYMNSFSDKLTVARFGKLFTSFNFSHASINEINNHFSLFYKDRFIHYSLEPDEPNHVNMQLREALMQIDRAYSIHDHKMKVTKVKRRDLPLQPARCSFFETNFFKHTELLGSFCVNEMLSYEWLPSQNCEFSARLSSTAA